MTDHITEDCFIKAVVEKRKFVINELHDNLFPTCRHKPLLLIDECEPYPRINTSVFDVSPPNEQIYMGELEDDHLIYRFTTVPDGFRMRLLDVATNVNIENAST